MDYTLGDIAGAASAGFGMLSSNTNQKRQYGQTKNLMGLQNKYQRGLNQQGHDLQMDMWNKTNYKAQLEHMKAAGLNPGLMYGMGGGGGSTTGSQGGGSQSMGNAEQQKIMGIEGAMAMTQMELMKAQANKANAEADNLGNKPGAKVAKEIEEAISRIKLNEQNMSESKKREMNLEMDTAIKKIDADWLKKNGTSTQEHQLLRAIKSIGGSVNDIAKFWIEIGKDTVPSLVPEKWDIWKEENN